MFDLNKIVTDALQQAVDARITELMQQHANIVGALAERITALENNPAIGTDTVLAERVVALEARVAVLAAELIVDAATHVPTLMSPEMIVESMNKAEWLWEKVNAYIETGIEDRIDDRIDDRIERHCETYDHDSYDSLYGDWSDYNPSSFVSEDDLDSKVTDAVSDALSNATVSISI